MDEDPTSGTSHSSRESESLPAQHRLTPSLILVAASHSSNCFSTAIASPVSPASKFPCQNPSNEYQSPDQRFQLALPPAHLREPPGHGRSRTEGCPGIDRHKTIQMTARCVHLSPDHLQSAVELISSAKPTKRPLEKPTATRTATSAKKATRKG